MSNPSLSITEKDFSRQVEDLLGLYNWRWCHFRPAMTKTGWRTAMSGHPGFPDYVAVRARRLLLFELKSAKGRIAPAQQEWIDLLHECGDNVECYAWRPGDFDEIVSILKGS